ncbi:sensor histidine kinase [Parablastomonas sp. CN1-191]|uniref:sensor histidine kinase n=1 Tax=Parablastomonas sp. CN1-191 TaxID=3400908 RepID=UPI003BF88E1A
MAAGAAPANDTIRARGGSGLLVGLTAVLALLAALVGYTTLAQRDARRHASENGDALIALNLVETDLLNAETGQRGYVLTAQDSYLGPFRAARGRIDPDMAEVERQFSSSSLTGSPQALIPLRALVARKVGELDRTIALVGAGHRAEALAVVGGGEGRRVMDAIRTQIAVLAANEKASRDAGIARAERAENMLLPLEMVLCLAMLALVFAALRTERRRAQATVLAGQAAALRDANDRAELLLRELNHRVKNVFAVIMSLVGLSSRRHPEGQALGDDLRARIHALALAHSASLGEGNVDAVPLRSVLERCLEPYDLDRLALAGPEVVLPVRAITPIGLVVHELATNAVKHGALNGDSGRVRLEWDVTQVSQSRKIALRWIESGMGALSQHPGENAGGFGTTMMTLASRQLGGTMTRSWQPDGIAVEFEFKVD